MVSFLLFSLAASAPVVLVGPSGIIATGVIKDVDTGMDVKAILVGPSGIIADGNLGSSGGDQIQSQFKQGQFDLARSKVKSSIVNSNCATPEDVKSALANSNRPALGSSDGDQIQSQFKQGQFDLARSKVKSSIVNSNCATPEDVKSVLANSNRPALESSGGEQSQSAFEKEKMNRQFDSSQEQQGGIASCIESKGVRIDSNDNFLLVGPNNGLLMGTGGVLKNMACVDKSQEVKDMIRDKSVKQDIVRRRYYGYGKYWNYWNSCH
jgi:hypothetical protein